MQTERGLSGPFFSGQKQEPKAKTTLNLTDSEMNWNLCGIAEQRGQDSLNHGLFVVVNDLLIVKLVGKMSGIAVETAEAENGGSFVKGYWYSPLEHNVRETIRRNFLAGITKQELTETNWMEIRLVRDENLLSRAQKAAIETPILTKFSTTKWNLKRKLNQIKEEYTGPRANNEPSA